MKKVILFAAFLISNISIFAQTGADEIIGIWETEAKDGKMQIFKSGNEYRAKLLWGTDIVEKDGKTSKKDVNNPDPKLRSRNIVGITYLTGLKFKNGQYENGKIYSSANGKTYNGYVWIEKGKLHLRGYIGFSLLGQTTKWNRVD